jgi:uncharacterized membrane protein YdbT with pleckstrin-like domain
LAGKPGEPAVSYVDSVLQPGETVRYRGDIHWKVYLPGLIVFLVGVLCFFAGPWGWIGAILILPALALLAWAWFQRWITEIAVTNRRIIYKRGFIQRHTIEMNMDKVESVDVEQSILGRLLDYGDIVVRGTGATLEPFRGIGAPLDFRNHVTAG